MIYLRITRALSATIGTLSALAAAGGVLLYSAGIANDVAAPCFFAGLTLACLIWWHQSQHTARRLLEHLAAANFSAMAGLALYANLVWALWAQGAPVDLELATNGQMGEHFWLGPFTLVYAGLCYLAVRHPANKGQPSPTVTEPSK